MKRKSRVFEFTAPNMGKGYVLARNESSALKKLKSNKEPFIGKLSYYDKSTREGFNKKYPYGEKY